jgi:phosphopantothenoylcysteine decarboxylase/phosphopantothenate--cysteine ligase
VSKVLLVASASAALHKAVDLASKLTQDGHAVRCVLTERAAELVSPQLFEAVTGEPAASTEYGPGRRGAMDHIDLASWTELVVCAPATADLVGRLAGGLASDLATTALLAVPAGIPRLLCPAMNPHMLAAPAVQRNLGRLLEDGWRLVEPGEGHMACGVAGQGRLAEVDQIRAAVRAEVGA